MTGHQDPGQPGNRDPAGTGHAGTAAAALAGLMSQRGQPGSRRAYAIPVSAADGDPAGSPVTWQYAECSADTALYVAMLAGMRHAAGQGRGAPVGR